MAFLSKIAKGSWKCPSTEFPLRSGGAVCLRFSSSSFLLWVLRIPVSQWHYFRNLQTFSSMFTFSRNAEKKFWRLKWNPPTVWWNEKKKNVRLNHSSFRYKWRFQSAVLDQERGSNQNCYRNSADENQLITEKNLHILFFSHGSCKMHVYLGKKKGGKVSILSLSSTCTLNFAYTCPNFIFPNLKISKKNFCLFSFVSPTADQYRDCVFFFLFLFLGCIHGFNDENREIPVSNSRIFWWITWYLQHFS